MRGYAGTRLEQSTSATTLLSASRPSAARSWSNERHDPVCLPGLAAILGEGLFPSGNIDARSRPAKAAQHFDAPHTLFSMEFADAAEKSPCHRRQQSSCAQSIRPSGSTTARSRDRTDAA